MLRLEQRSFREVCTDPQRRCYNGAWAKSEMQWSEWDWLEWDVNPENVEERLAYWRDLNDYAVECRGEGAKKEFRVREV